MWSLSTLSWNIKNLHGTRKLKKKYVINLFLNGWYKVNKIFKIILKNNEKFRLKWWIDLNWYWKWLSGLQINDKYLRKQTKSNIRVKKKRQFCEQN